MAGATVELTAAFAQLQLGFVDQTQWRYEVIRPPVLFADRTVQQQAQETHTRASKSWGSGRQGLLFQLQIWIPALELHSELPIQGFHPHLQ